MDNISTINRGLSQKTAEAVMLSKQELTEALNNIKKLNAQYEKIIASAEAFRNALSKIAKPASEDSEDSRTYNSVLWSLSSRGDEESLRANKFLIDLGEWTARAYHEVMKLRRAITGQTYTYMILNSKTQVYKTLTEEEYFELLQSTTTPNAWMKLSYSEKNFSDAMSYVNHLRLQIKIPKGLTKKGAKEAAENKDPTIVSLQKDALYQYLSTQKVDQRKKSGEKSVLYVSRLFELYSQLLHHRFDETKTGDGQMASSWQMSSSGYVSRPTKGAAASNSKYRTFFFSDRRGEEVDDFVQNYINAKMHRDPISVYKTGDAIMDACNLIENKVTGGGVSIKTVHKIVQDLANISLKDKQHVTEEFIKLFTYAGSGFAGTIQKEAKDLAVKNITKQVANIFKTTK